MTNKTKQNELVCVASIATVHGIHGVVKVKSFTQNETDFASLGTLCDKQAKRFFDVEIVGQNKGLYLVKIDGINDRTTAEALRGVELFVERSQLPDLQEDEFYFQDLVGMTAKTPEGEVLGLVKAVYNFGAGDILEIEGIADFVAFSEQNVPEIDMINKVMTVCLPQSVEVKSPVKQKS